MLLSYLLILTFFSLLKINKQPTKVARKLVLMEQDLERSEEKVELSERFVCFASYHLI